MNLVFTPKTAKDSHSFENFIYESPYYAELINGSFYFSVPNQEEADYIEKDLDKSRFDINGHWEIEE